MDYIELICSLELPTEEKQEILTALLGDIGYDSFEYSENGIAAYILESFFSAEAVIEIQKSIDFQFTYSFSGVEKKNWNEEWEKNFLPVYIKNFYQIRAPFHEKKIGYKLDLLITPKMSFGTGHHPTTRLMLEQMVEMNFENKNVLDMGSGTGILSIAASMLGAASVTAIEIDDWCYENIVENVSLNKVQNINIFTGGIELVNHSEAFDVIIANINRNVLLEQIPVYSNAMRKNAVLLLSGFYSEDRNAIEKLCSEHFLTFETISGNSNWIVLSFRKY
ncbi:MAG: ribosomal protein L11 methyltransferase [Bacteroidetes bacterium RIFOXYA12_FULL_35_11]|nr:MAG: ribosomal protein L11 methyltransferase [Bacteroidetes bacterium GWF2_35_48]OFY79287.1 MAG: ribosomal protein L11 methyltransferase [Bacteroidetes bacterium RIFOXYA12_FULL_35_11]OFY94136.1 MAG: ribosomal protein L11 methyltransferase [Bacteroidetes bacterium RIFOXYB2_FULL_35_7]OFZ00775.1 MAG: ribosomal protein L11 methyltransferase [Bacteroidetes bacterium RIFOXYC12_FULL_35_7]HBX53326.1 50S ribosomal protein L11 methyltransferase [Bacteroidales bacterium]